MIGDRIHTHVSLLRQPITKLKVKVLQSSSSLFYPNFVWNQIVSKKIYFRLLPFWERKPTFFLTKSNIFGFVKFSKSSTKCVIGTWFWALVYLLYWTAFFPSTTRNPVRILLKFDVIFWIKHLKRNKMALVYLFFWWSALFPSSAVVRVRILLKFDVIFRVESRK